MRKVGAFITTFLRCLVSPYTILIYLFLLSGIIGGVLYSVSRIIERESEKRAALKYYAPTIILRDRNSEYLDEIGNSHDLFGFWSIPGGIPPHVRLAILAAEDKRFDEHDGVDYFAVARAILQNFRDKKRVSGASTIPMQVVRLENPAERNYFNKLIEMKAARKLVARYGKEKILRQYLQIAPFGNRYHGIAYASEMYLQKPIQDVSLAEACLLASIPQSPGDMDLYDIEGRYRALERAQVILARLTNNQLISQREYENASEEIYEVPYEEKPVRPAYAMHAILQIRRQKMPAGSPIVYSSLDLHLQQQVNQYLRYYIERNREKGAGNVAAMITDKDTGEILVYIGSADYYDQTNKGSIDYACVPRSSGSILKPFLYAYGMMQKGYTGATVLSDIGMVFPSQQNIYAPLNSDRMFEGPILYRVALANSRNVPAVQVLNEVGIQETYDFFRSIGLVQSDKPADYYGLSVAIGGLYVELFNLIRCYGMLANDGQEYNFSWFKTDKKIVNDPRKQVIPPDIARMISLFLSDPMARVPTFRRKGILEYPFAVAIKTGTSQGFRDAWTLAYTHQYVLGVWTGEPDNQKMYYLGGSSASARAVRTMMWMIHPEEMNGLHQIPFQPPAGYVPRQICKITGKLATDFTPQSITEWFKPGTEPTEYSDIFQQIIIDKRTGYYYAEDCPEMFREKKVVAFLDPMFADWAKASGIDLPPVWGKPVGHINPRDPNDYAIKIEEPVDSIRLLINPNVPPEYQTIALKVKVDPPVEQVVWYVDNRPYQVTDFPYTTRWKLEPGEHEFQAKFPYSPLESQRVTVIVE